MLTQTTDDVRIERLRPLLPPAILMEELPAPEGSLETVARTRRGIADILHGRDDRLLAVVGPCSIHDTEAALEYGHRLAELAEKHKEDMLLVMRVYFEKPRTTVGWKGLINDPGLNNSFDINTGLRKARGLLLSLLHAGVPSATEFLDTITPQFIADLVTWGAIGARTTESQVHRELASGLSMPVGFKNGTNGNVDIAIAAIQAASHPHHFLSVTKQSIAAIVATRGNPNCHVILRGSSSGPNYESSFVQEAANDLRAKSMTPKIMVDCSHGNSSKDPAKQPLVARSIAEQVAGGATEVFGVMIESHLEGGRQNLSDDPLIYGKSITDGCLCWDDTVPVIEELADAVRKRRTLAK